MTISQRLKTKQFQLAGIAALSICTLLSSCSTTEVDKASLESPSKNVESSSSKEDEKQEPQNTKIKINTIEKKSSKTSLPKDKRKEYRAWKVSQTNQIFGPQEVFLNKNWMICENKREGTTYVRKVGEEHVIIYNTKRKVFFEGVPLNIMKRMELLTKITGTDLTNLKGVKTKWKFERMAKLVNRQTKIYSVKDENKTWKLWIVDSLDINPSVYQDYIDWSKLPSVGGMPLKLVSYNDRGKSTLYLDTHEITEVKVKAKTLSTPAGFKQVDEIFQVSSGRTEQLMESFSEILGD